MKILKAFFSLILCTGFVACSVAQDGRKFGDITYINYLVGTSWKVNGVPFENKDTESYSLSEYGEPDNIMDQWGHFIYFDTLTFSSHYSAPCGNDCFTSVRGTYWYSGVNRIQVKVTSIDRSGFCSEKSETINQDYGSYDLIKSDFGYDLKKVM